MALFGLIERYLPTALTALWGLLLFALLIKYFIAPYRDIPALRTRAHREKPRAGLLGRAISRALLYFLLSRLLVAAILAITCAASGTLASLFENPLGGLVRWDAAHYVSLAENFYVNEGDARLHIVFFPLYPMLLRGLYLMGMNAAWAGVLVSNLCLIGAGACLYGLIAGTDGEAAAERGLRYLMLAPMTIFYSIPYAESLFLLLTVAAVLAARRRCGWLAVLLGALASATRLLGLLVAVPIYYEYYRAAARSDKPVRGALLGAVKTLPVATGFAGYLYLNWAVAGDPLIFLTYQREHWSQTFGSLASTVRYTLRNALTSEDHGLILGTWAPQIVAIVLVLLLILLAFRAVRAGDGAYAVLYTYAALAPTWLLSGARYLSAMYPTYTMLAAITGKRPADAVVTAGLLAGLGYMTVCFIGVGAVM